MHATERVHMISYNINKAVTDIHDYVITCQWYALIRLLHAPQ